MIRILLAGMLSLIVLLPTMLFSSVVLFTLRSLAVVLSVIPMMVVCKLVAWIGGEETPFEYSLWDKIKLTMKD